MTMFGWCMSGHHGECIVEFERFYFGPVGKGRHKRQSVILLDEVAKCDCYCHNPEARTNK